jgi:hypothetical protein
VIKQIELHYQTAKCWLANAFYGEINRVSEFQNAATVNFPDQLFHLVCTSPSLLPCLHRRTKQQTSRGQKKRQGQDSNLRSRRNPLYL